MLITTTPMDNTGGPVTLSFGAGVVRRIRMVGMVPSVTTSVGQRTVTISNVRMDSGVTGTLAITNDAAAVGITRFIGGPNDGFDIGPDQPATITFTGTSSTYTCYVGYDRVT